VKEGNLAVAIDNDGRIAAAGHYKEVSNLLNNLAKTLRTCTKNPTIVAPISIYAKILFGRRTVNCILFCGRSVHF
jgi:hypothetical protein